MVRRYHPSMTGRVPAPQAVVGQVRAAPPAIDRIVPAEIFGPGQNRLTERGERQPGLLVTLDSGSRIVVHFDVNRPLVQARHGGRRRKRQSVQQRRRIPNSRTRAAGSAACSDGKASNGCPCSLAEISSSIRISVAPSRSHAPEALRASLPERLPKLRQERSNPVKQIEPSLRRRRSIGLPGRAGHREMTHP